MFKWKLACTLIIFPSCKCELDKETSNLRKSLQQYTAQQHISTEVSGERALHGNPNSHVFPYWPGPQHFHIPTPPLLHKAHRSTWCWIISPHPPKLHDYKREGSGKFRLSVTAPKVLFIALKRAHNDVYNVGDQDGILIEFNRVRSYSSRRRWGTLLERRTKKKRTIGFKLTVIHTQSRIQPSVSRQKKLMTEKCNLLFMFYSEGNHLQYLPSRCPHLRPDSVKFSSTQF